MDGHDNKKALILALKIGIGSSLAIFLAQTFNLQYPNSAGTVTLLTLITSKRGTIKLSIDRLISFMVAAFSATILLQLILYEWVAFGVYIFFVVLICNSMDWMATLSVNAVIGTHFLMAKDFGYGFIANEFYIVFIGVTIAIALNLFDYNRADKRAIEKHAAKAETDLCIIMGNLASYLSGRDMQKDVWVELNKLKEKLLSYEDFARELKSNSLGMRSTFFIDFFKFRYEQCNVLENLHNEMRRIRTMPAQAKVVSDFMLYLADYVNENKAPTEQLAKLKHITAKVEEEPLPETYDDFENRALLYHILIDLEEFLRLKAEFVASPHRDKKFVFTNIQTFYK